MTSPRMKMLERQLARMTPGASASSDSSASIFMDAVEKTIAEQASARIEAADERRKAAEDTIEKLRHEISDLLKEKIIMQKDAQDKMNEHGKLAKNEMENMCATHKQEMQKMKDETTSLRQELAGEQRARVKAEAQLESAKGRYAEMEQRMAKLKTNQPAPIIQQPTVAPTPKPLVAKVTQRDGTGRIVAITISPST